MPAETSIQSSVPPVILLLPSGLRSRLQEATTDTHRRIDAEFAGFDLLEVGGDCRLFEASAAALIPLEATLPAEAIASAGASFATVADAEERA